MGPRVTIVTPTYNHERYIGACLGSVVAQTVTDWELVVVDDGSDDSTVRVALEHRDPRITVVERPHIGLLGLRERYADGLAAGSAPLVAVLEGDDLWPPGKLEAQLADFEDDAVVLSYGAAALIDEFGCRYAVAGPRRRSAVLENRPIGAILPSLTAVNFIIAPTVVIRRSALEAIGGFQQPDGVPYVDHPTWLRLAEAGEFRYRPEILGAWRRHPAQYTTRHAAALPSWESYAPAAGGEAGGRTERRAVLNAYRLTLLAGTWRDVIGATSRLLGTGRPTLIALGVMGFVSRLAGGDLEWLVRLTRRVSWPSRRHRRRHRRAASPHS